MTFLLVVKLYNEAVIVEDSLSETLVYLKMNFSLLLSSLVIVGLAVLPDLGLAATSSPFPTAALFTTEAPELPGFNLLPSGSLTQAGTDNTSGRIGICVDANPVQSLNCSFLKSTNGTSLPFPAPQCANGTLYSSLLVYSNLSAVVEYISSLNNSYTAVSVLLMPGMHSIGGVIKLENISNVDMCGFGTRYETVVTGGHGSAGIVITDSYGINFENLVFTESGNSMPLVQIITSRSFSVNNCIFR